MSGALYHRQNPGPVLTRRDPVRAAAAYVGVPWRARGDDPAGWDCRGCVVYLRREIFGLASPGMGRDFYTAADVKSAATVEGMIRDRSAAWVPVQAAPGALILFEVFGRAAHIGLVLSGTDFVHSFGGQETTILRLDHPAWSRRIRGFYDTADPRLSRPGAVFSAA